MQQPDNVEQYVLRPGEGVVTLCGKSIVNKGSLTLYVKIERPIRIEITAATTTAPDQEPT